MLALSLTSSCHSYKPYCEELVDCGNGNQRDVDACVVGVEAEQDRADLYGCGDWFDVQQDCLEERSRCENGAYGVPAPSCDDEQRDYGSCMSD